MADRSLYSDTSSPMPTGLEFLDQYGDRGTQLFNAAIWPLSSVGGTANAVTASCDPPLLAGLVEHMKFLITWAADNTGGMTLVIEIFVYPNAFDTHGVWAVALLYLAKFGPGQFALDRLLFARAMPTAYGRA